MNVEKIAELSKMLKEISKIHQALDEKEFISVNCHNKNEFAEDTIRAVFLVEDFKDAIQGRIETLSLEIKETMQAELERWP